MKKSVDGIEPIKVKEEDDKIEFHFDKHWRTFKDTLNTLWILTVLGTVIISVFSKVTVTQCVQARVLTISGNEVTLGAVLAAVLLSDAVCRTASRFYKIHNK